MNKENNIFKKILNVQMDLQKMEFKKSGINKFSHFRYHELDDILPHIQLKCFQYGLMMTFMFDEKKATLLIIDVETGERFCNEMPMPEIKALSSAMNVIQSLGSFTTYLRRYLLLATFGICEKSIIDSDELSKAEARQARRNRVRPRQSQKQDGGLKP